MNYRLKTILAGLVSCLALPVAASSFSTDGNAIRCTAVADLDGQRALFLGEMDGAVACYTPAGEKLWRTESLEPAILFEILAADVDADGRDDVLTASGDGTIRCLNSDGSQRWAFEPGHKVRFSEIAVMGEGASLQIFAGATMASFTN